MEKNNKIDHVYTEEDIDHKDLSRSKTRVDSTAEVFTPEEIVNKMLDMVKPEDWSNPEITMLEPSCGDGNFVVVMISRFMDGLVNVIPDPEQRFKHIVEKQVYALDIMPDNINAALNRIDSVFGFNIRDYEHNIWNKDTLAYDCLFGKDYMGEFGVVYAEKKENNGTLKVIEKEKEKITKPAIDDFFDF